MTTPSDALTNVAIASVGCAGAPLIESDMFGGNDVDVRHEVRMKPRYWLFVGLLETEIDRGALGEGIHPEESTPARRQLVQRCSEHCFGASRPRQLALSHAEQRSIFVVAYEPSTIADHLSRCVELAAVDQTDGQRQVELGSVAKQGILIDQATHSWNEVVRSGSCAEAMHCVGRKEVVVPTSRTYPLGPHEQLLADLPRRLHWAVEPQCAHQPIQRSELLLRVAFRPGDLGRGTIVLVPATTSGVRQRQA